MHSCLSSNKVVWTSKDHLLIKHCLEGGLSLKKTRPTSPGEGLFSLSLSTLRVHSEANKVLLLDLGSAFPFLPDT